MGVIVTRLKGSGAYIREKFSLRKLWGHFLRGFVWALIIVPTSWALGYEINGKLLVLLIVASFLDAIIYPNPRLRAVEKAVDEYNKMQATRGYHPDRSRALTEDIQKILGKLPQ